MKILVTNPTGRIGRKIVPELLAPEFSVRVIARDPAKLPVEIREQVEVIPGSMDDPATLRHALEGVEAMFWCIPAESPQTQSVERHYERFAFAGWRAIREAGTPRVVAISARVNTRARRAGPISALHEMEQVLNETSVAIRHLRCGLFMENFLAHAPSIERTGSISLPISGDVPVPMVAVTDIAEAALRWLVRRDWEGIEGVAVNGPEDVSFDEAAGVFERILERPVRFREASTDEYIQALVHGGASNEYARAQAEMLAEVGHGILQAEPGTMRAHTPTTLAAWTRSNLVPALEVSPRWYEPLALVE